MVAAPIFQVDGFVGDVPVAADDVLAAVGQAGAKKFGEAFHEAVFDRLPFLAGRSRWHIDRCDAQVVETGFQVAAFCVHVFPAEAADDLVRCFAAV